MIVVVVSFIREVKFIYSTRNDKLEDVFNDQIFTITTTVNFKALEGVKITFNGFLIENLFFSLFFFTFAYIFRIFFNFQNFFLSFKLIY